MAMSFHTINEQMKKLSTYDYKGLFLPSYIRKKSSFNAELWSLLFNKLLPNHYLSPDIRSLLNKKKLASLYTAIDEIGAKENSEHEAFIKAIRRDATISFNALASIINGEQQNLYIHDRLKRLSIHNIFISGIISKENQINKIESQLGQLKKNIKTIRRSYKNHGTNIHLTYRVEKLSSDLTQACDIISLCKNDCPPEEVPFLIKKLIERNLLNKDMLHYISTKTSILTKTIVEHNSAHGEKYIATNFKEYTNIFKASLIGGLMIAFFALFKIEIESWGFPLLGEGLLFGINYALCFILVDIFGGIIATKQPAMTANTLLSKIAITENNDDDVPKKIANVFTDVSKSQFISFLGNLSVAFIISIIISYFYTENYDQPLIDYEKGTYLLSRNNITGSGTIFYAAIAGLFLSISGFIAGYMDNAILFYKLNERIKQKSNRNSLRSKFYNYTLKKFGKFIGSFSLGMFLGLAGAIGLFSGIPFDIRHVAFSSAHIAYGSQAISLDWISNIGILLVASIFMIGIINFLVSFIITLFIALSSKKLKNKEILKGFVMILRALFTKPWLFILPVKFNQTLKD